eukprot:8860545-Pyramimonas_sp.AAC.1
MALSATTHLPSRSGRGPLPLRTIHSARPEGLGGARRELPRWPTIALRGPRGSDIAPAWSKTPQRWLAYIRHKP